MLKPVFAFDGAVMKKVAAILFILVAAVSGAVAWTHGGPGLRPVIVIQNSQYNAFPGLTRVIATSDGKSIPVAVYRAGASHVSTDGVLKVQTSSTDGVEWSSAVTLYDPGVAGSDARDPEIITLPDNSVLLTFFVSSMSQTSSHAYLMRCTTNSTVTVFTCGTPVEIGVSTFSPPNVAISGKAIALANGTYGAPIYYINNGQTKYSAAVVPFTVSGSTITPSAQINVFASTASNEYTEWNGVQIAANGRVVAISRQDQGTLGYARSVSTDNMLTWSAPSSVISASDIGRPSLVELSDGHLWMMARFSGFLMGYAKSTDAEGETWPAFTTYGSSTGEYASAILYPGGSMVSTIISMEVPVAGGASVTYQNFAQ